MVEETVKKFGKIIYRPFAKAQCPCDLCGKPIKINEFKVDYDIKRDTKHLHTGCMNLLQTYERLVNYMALYEKNSKSSDYFLWLCKWHDFLREYLIKICLDDVLLRKFNLASDNKYNDIRHATTTDDVICSLGNIPELINELNKVGA